MAKYNFSTVGAAECYNYYKVRFFRCDAQFKDYNVKEYVLATPLDMEELIVFVKARVSSLNLLDLHVETVLLGRDGDVCMRLPRLGLSGLAFLLSGKGITPETIDIKFNGKVYNVDVDKYAKFLESMQ